MHCYRCRRPGTGADGRGIDLGERCAGLVSVGHRAEEVFRVSAVAVIAAFEKLLLHEEAVCVVPPPPADTRLTPRAEMVPVGDAHVWRVFRVVVAAAIRPHRADVIYLKIDHGLYASRLEAQLAPRREHIVLNRRGVDLALMSETLKVNVHGNQPSTSPRAVG